MSVQRSASVFWFFQEIQAPNRLPIVQASLFCHIFQAVNFMWQQTRGAGIGSHISPSLFNLAVTIVERSWTQVFKEVLDLPTFPFFLPPDPLTIGVFSFPRRRFKSPPYKSHFLKTFINFHCNWRQSPAMNCRVFLLISTFERWPINSHSLDHLFFLHRLDKVHQKCSTQRFSFRFFKEIQAPNRFFPIVQASVFCHICPVVNIIWMNCGVFLLTCKFPRTQQIFPIVQTSLFCHILHSVNMIWQQIRGAKIALTLVHPSPT